MKSVYVCDLGVAKLCARATTLKTSQGMGAGTAPYIITDRNSSGCLFIWLSTYQALQWNECGETSMLPKIMQKVCGSYDVPPTSPSTDHVPQMYQKVCRICTDLDHEMRPTAAEILHLVKLSGD